MNVAPFFMMIEDRPMATNYQVTIRTFGKDGAPGEAWFVFGHDAPTISDLHAQLIDEGALLGRRYDTKPAGDGVRRVRGSTPCILSRDIILQVTPLPGLLCDADGVQIGTCHG